MTSLIQAFIACLCGAEPTIEETHISEKQPLLSPTPIRTTEETAARVIDTLNTTKKRGSELQIALNDIVGECGWTERLVEWILVKLEQVLREAEKLSPYLREAYEKSCEAATAIKGFVKDHPVFCTLVAIGVLVTIAPWMVEVLGFAEAGPVQGTFAAAWQARYAGYVPKGSLFSFFQRLGMKWAK
ncbi:hypothetical protein CC80DRAFT_461167 [Byssothecium circinans]|uniref:Lincomycin-condensing protein lmbA n=1 Tax=Byssothecium circinans TaxID=147558 RepID=A0A6A5UD31_9PLEO|nr:hypothetical protein CC80DRAFT_461167 [Byssothecium circinans]